MLQQHGLMIDLGTGEPLAGTTVGKGNDLVSISNSGEINAHSVTEALQAIQKLQSLSSQGTVGNAPATSMQRAQARDARMEALSSAMNDSKEWASLGSALGQRIEEFSERNGFLRRLCEHMPLSQGQLPRIPMEQNIGQAIVASAPSDLDFQVLRSKIFNPVEFEMKAHIRVSQLDMEQVAGDLLDDAYQQGQQALTVTEDRLWKDAADKSVGVINPLTQIVGGLTPGYLSRLRTHLTKWNIPARTALISNDYWDDIHGSSDWATALDPITRHDLVLNGQIATLQGMTLITDGFRNPTQVVLKPGELYVVGDSKFHGTYTSRGGIRSKAVDGANSGETSQGWLLWQMFSFTLGNLKSVSKGTRG